MGLSRSAEGANADVGDLDTHIPSLRHTTILTEYSIIHSFCY